MEKKSLEGDVKEYYENWANDIISRNWERIQQIRKEIEEKEKKLKMELDEFNSITDVWEAARYAKNHEPNKAWKEYPMPYVPSRHRERQAMLLSLYPKCKDYIRRMNANQSRWVLLSIRQYTKKIEEEMSRYSNLFYPALRGY